MKNVLGIIASPRRLGNSSSWSKRSAAACPSNTGFVCSGRRISPSAPAGGATAACSASSAASRKAIFRRRGDRRRRCADPGSTHLFSRRQCGSQADRRPGSGLLCPHRAIVGKAVGGGLHCRHPRKRGTRFFASRKDARRPVYMIDWRFIENRTADLMTVTTDFSKEEKWIAPGE